jgi:hypothetical protein
MRAVLRRVLRRPTSVMHSSRGCSALSWLKFSGEELTLAVSANVSGESSAEFALRAWRAATNINGARVMLESPGLCIGSSHLGRGGLYVALGRLRRTVSQPFRSSNNKQARLCVVSLTGVRGSGTMTGAWAPRVTSRHTRLGERCTREELRHN